MELVNLKDKKVLCWDNGVCVEAAVRLARDFGTVWYFSSWKEAYPTIEMRSIGMGLEDEGVIRVDDFWSYVDKADLIYFGDGRDGDLVDYLRGKGYRVWGAGSGEEMEFDRVGAKEYMRHLKMPVNEYEAFKGIDALRKYLKDEKNKDKFIKSDLRGVHETFHHEDYKLTEPVLNSIEKSLGASKNEWEFVAESPIPDAVEAGVDTVCIDGQYPEKIQWGYEVKDLGYCCRVQDYKECSKLLTDSLDKMAPYFKKKKYRGYLSTELRIGEDKKPYLIDWCMRTPSPPGELYYELWKNFSEVIWHGANGEMIPIEYAAKYGIEAIIYSSWAAGDEWQAIHFPKEIRRWIKIKNLYKKDDTYYFIPARGGYAQIGGVVAYGNTLDECVDKLKGYSDQIKGHKIDVPVGSVDKAKEQIEMGEKLGLKF